MRSARAQDHRIVEQQLDTGLTGVALPLKDRRGVTRAAIGNTLQVQSWSREQIEAKLLPLLRGSLWRAAARAICARSARSSR